MGKLYLHVEKYRQISILETKKHGFSLPSCSPDRMIWSPMKNTQVIFAENLPKFEFMN